MEKFIDFLQSLWTRVVDFLPTLLMALVIYAVGWVVMRMLLHVMRRGMRRTKADQSTVGGFIQSILRIALQVLLMTIVLGVLGVPTNSIITVIGTAGVAIGLALQGSLSNVAGGVILLVQKPFGVGDFIVTPDAAGTVRRINVLYTELTTPDNCAVFVPNGKLSASAVVNHSAHDTRRLELTVPVAREADITAACAGLRGRLAEISTVCADPAPLVAVSEYTAASVIVMVRVWCPAGAYEETRLALTRELHEAAGRLSS